MASKKINPAAVNFNHADSDQEAIVIADKVMKAMGGRVAYDKTRYISWNFFGSRKHVWDKNTGDVHITSLKDNYIVEMNIHTMKGELTMKGSKVTQPDSLTKYLQKGKEMWINDAYWLVMPYKLKDSGVTLKHLGASETADGRAADKLELTFKSVGVTPDNKYHVYVDKESDLVTQWDFYPKYDDTEPRFSTPWTGYKRYGEIMLSGGRGKYELSEIGIGDAYKSVFDK